MQSQNWGGYEAVLWAERVGSVVSCFTGGESGRRGLGLGWDRQLGWDRGLLDSEQDPAGAGSGVSGPWWPCSLRWAGKYSIAGL